MTTEELLRDVGTNSMESSIRKHKEAIKKLDAFILTHLCLEVIRTGKTIK